MDDIDLAIEKLKELGFPDLSEAVLNLYAQWIDAGAPWREY